MYSSFCIIKEGLEELIKRQAVVTYLKRHVQNSWEKWFFLESFQSLTCTHCLFFYAKYVESFNVHLNLILLTSCGRKSQCHSGLFITLPPHTCPGWKRRFSGRLPRHPLSRRLPGIIQNFSAPSHLLAKGEIAERRGVNVPKWLALILKLSMRPRREGSVKLEITENLCKAEKTKTKWEENRLFIEGETQKCKSVCLWKWEGNETVKYKKSKDELLYLSNCTPQLQKYWF